MQNRAVAINHKLRFRRAITTQPIRLLRIEAIVAETHSHMAF